MNILSKFQGLKGDELSLELYKAIEQDFPGQCKDVFNSHTCEIEPVFMGFVTQYYHLSQMIPKDYIILDMGCYASAQGYFFQDYRKYIGIDTYLGKRFQFKNTINLVKDIGEVVDKWKDKKNITNNTFVICNYVSALLGEKKNQAMRNSFCNIFNFYPTETRQSKDKPYLP